MPSRSEITFAQAEGVEPLPQQLAPKSISPQMRALLWAVVFGDLKHHRISSSSVYASEGTIGAYWLSAMRDYWVTHQHRMVNEFSASYAENVKELQFLFQSGDYVRVLGFIEFLARRRNISAELIQTLGNTLEYCRSAYRLVDGSIIPFASSEEREVVVKAIETLSAEDMTGSKSHLLRAGSYLSSGQFADSVRESINAVESVVRTLSIHNSLSEALKNLERTQTIHPALKSAIDKLYGYAGDEQGIRHPLLDKDGQTVDEATAFFMYGACASLVTYLVRKGRAAGLLTAQA